MKLLEVLPRSLSDLPLLLSLILSLTDDSEIADYLSLLRHNSVAPPQEWLLELCDLAGKCGPALALSIFGLVASAAAARPNSACYV
jgi:hypothetical protein